MSSQLLEHLLWKLTRLFWTLYPAIGPAVLLVLTAELFACPLLWPATPTALLLQIVDHRLPSTQDE